MECRLINLHNVFQGLLKTGIPLIEYHNETLNLAYLMDDIGIYAIIPQLAYYFNCPLEQVITYFFYSLLIIPFFVGLAGLYTCYKTMLPRLISTLALSYLARKSFGLTLIQA